MYAIEQSETFKRWRLRMRDRAALLRINSRLRRMELGHFGDAKHVGQGVRELRIDYGPGYRIYYVQRGRSLVVLLSAGTKDTQQDDIRGAITIAAAWDRKR
jgi:putative addiction module killer protein